MKNERSKFLYITVFLITIFLFTSCNDTTNLKTKDNIRYSISEDNEYYPWNDSPNLYTASEEELKQISFYDMSGDDRYTFGATNSAEEAVNITMQICD